jgi:hypothetical protein
VGNRTCSKPAWEGRKTRKLRSFQRFWAKHEGRLALLLALWRLSSKYSVALAERIDPKHPFLKAVPTHTQVGRQIISST